MIQFDEQTSKQQEEKTIKAWKSKSLNSKFMERYKIPLEPKKVQDKQSSKKKQSKGEQRSKAGQPELLPEPKFKKINQEMFCCYLQSSMQVFKLLNEEQKKSHSSKLNQNEKEKTFQQIAYSFESNIKFVVGNNSQLIYVGLENQLHILKLEQKQKKIQESVIKYFQICPAEKKKQIMNIKGVSFIKQLRDKIQIQILVVITSDKVLKYKLSGTRQQAERPLQEINISFLSKKDQQVYSELNSIRIISAKKKKLYLFATHEGVESQINEKSEKKQRKCQFLYLVQFDLAKKQNEADVTFWMIDHVFQTGIFSKSKIFQVGVDLFLISLFEQIIAIRKHYNRYVVWDNISLAPSKSIEKKGQLILADKMVMVYTEAGQIYAHNIHFSTKQSNQKNKESNKQNKLKYPHIDNFRGNANEDEILYDAIVLQYVSGSFMKVLLYFKQNQVYTPNNRYALTKQDKIQAQHKQLSFYITCIQQTQPVEKLMQLYKNKKTPQEIAQFVQRFNITQLERSKCQWQASDKTQKDIENLLLDIKDNEYIQNQLTSILKSNPHDLKFLGVVQKKQAQRYKKMLVNKLLKNDKYYDLQTLNQLYASTGSYFTKDQVTEIKSIIQWVLQSIMFEKKLQYSRSFLEFMEYDFIDIGKLKAASLKQEIKLLSCKGYKQRLKYFLNNFKYMILANFQDIFNFLIEGKSPQEVETFFKDNYPFILPRYSQTSKVFLEKKQAVRVARIRKQTFALTKDQKIQIQPEMQDLENKEKVLLWENKFEEQAKMEKFQTKQNFETKILQQLARRRDQISAEYKNSQKKLNSQFKLCLKLQDANREFLRIFRQFTREQWFIKNRSKQHSIISVDEKTLEKQFQYFVRIGVFHLLVKFFYHKISQQKYTIQAVDKILQSFKTAQLIPQSFQKNILARRQIYEIIKKKKLESALPTLQDFLIKQQTDHFDFLFTYCKEMLLKEIKNCYDGLAPGFPGFFKEKFLIYLNSDKIRLREIIKFLQFFQGNNQQSIRFDIFTCIKNLLKVSDKNDTSFFVEKLMELEILKQKQGSQGSSIDELIDEAKIAFGYYFYNFFAVFKIEETYKKLIDETSVKEYENCCIIKTIMQKYCVDDYLQPFASEESDNQTVIIFEPCFGLQYIELSIKQNPNHFFGIMLYLIDTLRFQISAQVIFDKFIQLLLIEKKYGDIVYFISQFRRLTEVDQFNQQQLQDESESKIDMVLKAFYNQSTFNIEDQLVDNLLKWTKTQYTKQLKKIEDSKDSKSREGIREIYSKSPIYENIKSAYLEIIDTLQLNTQQINREKNFLALLMNIKQIQPYLVHYVLKNRFKAIGEGERKIFQENSALLNETSGFIFMIRLLNQIPKQKFDRTSVQIQLQKQNHNKKRHLTTRQEINTMQNIYEYFTSASKYNNKQKQLGLSNFFIQFAMRLIKDKQFDYCKQVLASKCYAKDVFYQFLSLIKPNQKRNITQGFTKFIKNFIQVQSSTNNTNMVNMFNSFLAENQISSFIDSVDLKAHGNKESQGLNQGRKLQKNSQLYSKLPSSETKKNTATKQSKFLEKTQYLGFKNFQNKEDIMQNKFTSIIFQCLLQSHRVDEGYYFLVRNTTLKVINATKIGQNNRGTEGQALISIYLKCLQQFLCVQFFATFDFYRNKLLMLHNEYQRKDIIKDINIAISRLKQKIIQKRSQILGKQNPKQNEKTTEPADKKIPNSQENKHQDKQVTKQQQHKKKAEAQQNKYLTNSLVNEEKILLEHQKDLEQLYIRYMNANNLDPQIKLNQQDMLKGKMKFESMSNQPEEQENMNRDRIMPPSPRFVTKSNGNKIQNGFTAQELSRRMIADSQKQLQTERKKVKENPQFIQFQKEINHQIKQSKMLVQKYQKFQTQLPKISDKNSKNLKAYQQLKQKQKADLDSVKQSYKSQAAERVNHILQQLKLRRSKIYEKSDAKSKFSKVSIDQSQEARSRKTSFENVNLALPLHTMIPKMQRQASGSESNFSNQNSSRKYEVKLHSIDGQTKNIYMPVTINKQQKQSSNVNSRMSIHSKQLSSNMIDVNKNIKNQIKYEISSSRAGLRNTQHLGKPHPKFTFEQILKLFAQKQPQCVKYVEKLQLVKNNIQVGLQITKNIYSTIYNFDVFVRYIGFLLDNYPKYAEIIQEKAYKIAVQSMGIECKINLKQLFPIQIFTTTSKSALKQYYKIAYDILRPNLLKILSKSQTNVHGIAVLFRFGFGSENVYYYRVYEDYIRVLLKEYSQNAVDEKKLFFLAEKLRSYYDNINPQNRQQKFEQLMRETTNEQKRKVLCKQMIKILERRGQMLTGQKQVDLKNILTKLS